MADYIDRNELVGNLDKFAPEHLTPLLRTLIEKQPTADVVEVKHGEWIKTDRGIRKSVNTGQSMRVYACDCSCCRYHTGNQGTEFNYCPRCGAKMDGVRKDDV